MATELEQANKRTKYAWAMYFRAKNENHRTTITRIEYIETLPEFVKSEMREMIAELKKEVSCPICLEEIDIGVLDWSRCGHPYCETCLARLKKSVQGRTPKCAICRKKL
jgi:hypothetical protein